jgi:hypothetical protein
MWLGDLQIGRINKAARLVGTSASATFYPRVCISGSYTVIASDASASTVTLPTGLPRIFGWQTEIYRSGSVINSTYNVSASSGSLTILGYAGATGSVVTGSYTLQANDIIMVNVF